MPWPVTGCDKHDEEFFKNPPVGVSPKYVAAYYTREICGCGDHLLTPEEKKDGICEMCKGLENRTPRP